MRRNFFVSFFFGIIVGLMGCGNVIRGPDSGFECPDGWTCAKSDGPFWLNADGELIYWDDGWQTKTWSDTKPSPSLDAGLSTE